MAYTVSEQLVAQDLDGEIILVDLASDHYFGAAGVAREIWEMVADGRDRESICRALQGRYPAEAASIPADVDEFLDQLVGAGLIRATATLEETR